MNLTELKNTAEFYRSRLLEIKTQLWQIKQLQTGLQNRIQALNAQIGEKSVGKQPVSEIVVTVQADAPSAAEFQVRYVTQNASWRPLYDVRVPEVGKPLQLSYKAEVMQNSNEAWNNVNLTLSTANPNESGTRPDLQIWRLGFDVVKFVYPELKLDQDRIEDVVTRNAPARPNGMVLGGRLEEKPLERAQELEVQQVEDATSVSFKIDLPYTIPSDGKAQVVQIKQPSIPANYEYYVAPKLETDAFLTAQITDWQNYSLLSANANLFLEDRYVGRSFVDAISTQDTLTFSLGRDKSLITKRTKLKNASNRAFLSNKRSESVAFEIEVRNTKRTPIRLVLQDQIPVSSDEKIVVKLDEASEAEYNEASGILTWRLNLNTGETKKLIFKYTVSYPKDKLVRLE